MQPLFFLRRAAVIALLCAAGSVAAIPANEVGAEPDEAEGALVGDLMFHADLLDRLDRLCRRGGSSFEWHAALPALPPEAMTPELLALSRRLAADAAERMLQDNGGCATRTFSDAYLESRQTFDELIVRWRER